MIYPCKFGVIPSTGSSVIMCTINFLADADGKTRAADRHQYATLTVGGAGRGVGAREIEKERERDHCRSSNWIY